MKRRRAALAPLLLAGACADFPRDAEGTLERARAGTMRAAIVSDPTITGSEVVRVQRLLDALGDGSRVERSAEALLLALEKGEVDLVVGRFDKKTPWDTRVTFTKPMMTRGELELKAATRNGEHAWAMRVERAALAR